MVNSLVLHKRLCNIGIGCISKELKNHYWVNFGENDRMKCSKEALKIIDTSECKELPFDDFKRMSVTNSKDLPEHVIIGNELKHWVGIGWVTVRVVNFEDLKKYPRVV